MNYGYWDDEETVYGTVTSQVAQTITLNEEYQIDKIYVSAGDTVKEGTPLFSYDMTLPELEAALAWLERNHLADFLHLLDGDARYAWAARQRSTWRPRASRGR